MDNIKREKEVSWMSLVQQKDPTIFTRPVATYIFNDGKKTFYKPRKK